MSDQRRKSPAQLDREIAEVLASRSHAAKKSRRESPSAWMSTAAGIIEDKARASEAYQRGREEVIRSAIALIGPSPSPDRLRALGGLTKIVADQVAIAETPGLDANLGSPLFPHTPRSQLAREVGALRADVQLLLAKGSP
jgi:hypothetical protein